MIAPTFADSDSGGVALGCYGPDGHGIAGTARQVADAAREAGFTGPIIRDGDPSALADLPGPLPAWAVSATFLAVLLCSLSTELIGVHAVFGAFLLGAILPHDGRIAHDFAAKLKDPVTVLLLPAFFAVTGLRTRIGLMDSAGDWLWCGAVILVATAGKFGGTYAAARLTGSGRRDAAALGAMMNTRGLMGLIVLDVGRELGVVGPKLYAVLVLTCLATTAMTAPALAWLGRRPSRLF